MVRAGLILMVLWPTSMVMAGECDDSTPIDNNILRQDLDDAESVYADENVAGKLASRSGPAMADLPCLNELVETDVAQRYHLLQVMLADPFGKAGEQPKVQAGIARMRQLGVPKAIELLPADHGTRAAAGANANEGVVTKVPAPSSGSMAFDGTPGLARPTNATTIWQLLDADRRVVQTNFLFPTDPLPPYDTRSSLRPKLLTASVATGALAAVFYGSAMATKSGFDPEQHGPGRVRTNAALTFTSVGLAVVAAGTGVGGVLASP